MKQHTDLGIVIGRVDYGERDRILTLLCRQNGKVSVLAKSVRSAKSRLAGGIELLSESEITFLDGKSNLKILTAARLKTYFKGVAVDMRRMQQAFTYIKAVNTITEEGTGQEYYRILSTSLEALNGTVYDARIVDIWFNLQILRAYGSEPNLAADNSAQIKNFQFDYDRQQFIPAESGIFTVNDLKLLRLCSDRKTPPKIENPLGSEDRLQALTSTLLKTNITEV